jgi:acetyl esterase/lipase
MQIRPNFDYLREIFDPDRYAPQLGKHNAAYAAELAKQSGPPTSLDVKVLREATAAFLEGKGLPYPKGMSAASYQETNIGGMQCFQLKHPNSEAVPTIVMYFAGGFCLESMGAVQSFMANVTTYLPCNIVLPNYPLAPEVKAPEILLQIDQFLQALLRNLSLKEVALMGWSSGGNLALTSYLNLQQSAPELARQVKQLILIGPWIDISMQVSKFGPFQKQQNMDRTSIGPDVIAQMARWYLPEGCNGAEPEYCPASRNPDELKTVPPVAVIIGDCEGIFGDAAFITYHLRHSGAKAQLMVLKGQTHNHVCFEELSLDTPFVPELIAQIVKRESLANYKGLTIY